MPLFERRHLHTNEGSVRSLLLCLLLFERAVEAWLLSRMQVRRRQQESRRTQEHRRREERRRGLVALALHDFAFLNASHCTSALDIAQIDIKVSS